MGNKIRHRKGTKNRILGSFKHNSYYHFNDGCILFYDNRLPTSTTERASLATMPNYVEGETESKNCNHAGECCSGFCGSLAPTVRQIFLEVLL